MKNSIIKTFGFIAIFLSGLFSFQMASAQNYTLNNDTSFLEVHGTSSLHDWHVDAEKQMGTLELTNAEGLNLSALNFSVEVESLKSGKSGMDKNTYKALKSDSYSTIDFKMSSVDKVTKLTENSYEVTVTGQLTVVGVSKSKSLDLKIKTEGHTVLIDGEKTMLMTDFGIDPPKALFGTIKTGDEIKIVFKTVFKNK